MALLDIMTSKRVQLTCWDVAYLVSKVMCLCGVLWNLNQGDIKYTLLLGPEMICAELLSSPKERNYTYSENLHGFMLQRKESIYIS